MNSEMVPLDKSKGQAGTLVRGGNGCLLVDFDGTISEIVDEPQAARVFPGVVAALNILATSCHVAIVSGRPVAWLRQIVGSPHLSYVGIHGAQVANGQGPVVDLTGAAFRSDLASVKVELVQWLESKGHGHGISLEDKGASLSLHYRRAADVASVYRLIHEMLATKELAGVMEVRDGRMVVELRPAGFDKGGVIKNMVAEVRPDWLIYAGDDRTDADAFLVAKLIREGGSVKTLTVGVFSQEWPADAVCSPDYWASSVSEFAGWLGWLATKSSS